jgi:hypothetical protein
MARAKAGSSRRPGLSDTSGTENLSLQSRAKPPVEKIGNPKLKISSSISTFLNPPFENIGSKVKGG